MDDALGNLAVKGDNLCILGRILLDSENYDISKEHFEQALEIYQELDNQKDIALVFNNLGRVYDENGDIIKAKEYYNKALQIVLELGLEDDRLTEIIRNNLNSLEE